MRGVGGWALTFGCWVGGDGTGGVDLAFEGAS